MAAAVGLLKTELIQQRKNAQLVDQNSGEQDVDPVRILAVLLHNQPFLEGFAVLHKTIRFQLAVLGDQIGPDDVRRDDG